MSLVAVLGVASAVRLAALSFPSVTDRLGSFVELSTPLSSFTRLQEGVYLFSRGQMPYEGPFYQSPLLLTLFSLFDMCPTVLFILADVFAAWQLAAYAAKQQKAFSPAAIAAVYLFNPFSLLSTLARSSNVFTNALICGSLGAAAARKPAQAVIFLALAAVLSFYPLYLLFGLIGVCRQYSPASIAKLTTVFITAVLAFLGLAYLPLQSWSFIDSQYGTQLLLRDLTSPNIGLWWYFFIEIIEFFRPFFIGAFQMFLLSFPVPLIVRFRKIPLFAITSVVGILAVFKPYPEASDIGLYLVLIVLDRNLFDLLEYVPLEALGLLYVTVLSPTFYYLWIYQGSGNANFFYAITLVYAVTMVVIFGDTTWSAIRLDFDGGKAKNLVQL